MPSFFQAMLAAGKRGITDGVKSALKATPLGRIISLGDRAGLTPKVVSSFFHDLQKFNPHKYESVFKIIENAVAQTSSNNLKAVRSTLSALTKVSNVISGTVNVFQTARYAAHNPILFLLNSIEPLKYLQSTVVPIKNGRIVGKHSPLYLKYSLMLDHIFPRKTQTDLQAYFRPPVIRQKNSKGQVIYTELPNHPSLQRSEITNQKSLYIASMAIRRMLSKERYFKSIEDTLLNNSQETIRNRWVSLIQDVRRRYNKNVKELNREFREGKLSETAYTHLVTQEYNKSRRLVSILTAGGVGRLKQEGLFKIEHNLKMDRDAFTRHLQDNIAQYKRLVDKNKARHKDYDPIEKQKEKEKQKQTVKTILNNLKKKQLDRDSEFNKYLRQRSVNNPDIYAISSLKQSKIRSAMRRMYSNLDLEDSMKDLFSNLGLTEEQELQITKYFHQEYGNIYRKLKNATDAADVRERMEVQILQVNQSQFNLDYAANRLEAVDTDPLDNLIHDKSQIEIGYRQGSKLGNEAVLSEIEQQYGNKRTVWIRKVTSDNECEVCLRLDNTVYDSEEEAYQGHSQCYNHVYNGDECYCEVDAAVVEEDEYDSLFESKDDDID